MHKPDSPGHLLVTGAAGFIGSSFVRQALAQGYQVTILDAFTYAGHRENLAGLPVEILEGRIEDGAQFLEILRTRKIDSVVNFAAESHVDRSIASPAAFIHTNVLGTFAVLEASLHYLRELPEASKTQFRVIQVSTDEIYGSLGPTGYFSETTPIQPNSPYSASKAAGDLLARAWFHTYGLPVITTNCSNNYGPRQHPEKLIPRATLRALRGDTIPVFGDGMNVRDWIHVEDHCAGILLALQKGRPGETYCFGGRAERPNLEVVHTLCDELDQARPLAAVPSRRKLITFVTDRAGHDRRYAIDDSKAERELGFTRKHTFEQGMRETVRWYLDNEPWIQSVTGGIIP
jgi:dTDP-glucose 4,6-dehydratase